MLSTLIRRSVLTILLAFFVTLCGKPQERDNELTLTLQPSVQRWSLPEGKDAVQHSSVLTVSSLVGRDLSVTVQAAQAEAREGDSDLGGLSDLHVALRYNRSPSPLSVIVVINVPTGKRNLTVDEFLVATTMAHSVFAFRVPTLGEGWGIRPGISLLIPLNHRIALGVAGSYSLRGQFQPLESHDSFNPGDEVLLNVGMDAKLLQSTMFGGDLVFTRHGTDRWGGDDVYPSGWRFVGQLRATQAMGDHRASLLFRRIIRSKGGDRQNTPVLEFMNRLEPNQSELRVSSRFRLSELAAISISLGRRQFDASGELVKRLALTSGDFGSEIGITDRVQFSLLVQYELGRFTTGEALRGFGFGGGLRVGIR